MIRIVLFLSVLMAAPLFAGKWDEMNYGPYLTHSLEVRGAGIVNKGIAIRLDAGEGGVSKGNAFMLYDTDLLNCAVGWGGGFIDWRGIAMDGRHNAHASIRGDQTFANPVGPGWRSPAGKWEDTVRVRGLDKKPYGPLPRTWAHYKGLYVHGNKVVLSYTVGARGVFEMPSLHGENVFIRNLQIAPGTSEIVMQVAQGKDAKRLNGSRNIVQVGGSQTDQPVIAAAVLGETGLWDLEDGKNLRLRIPAATKAHRLRVLIWSGPAADVKGFAKAVATVQSEDEAPNLLKLTQGGKAQWTETVETQIQAGLDLGPYATDTFQLPDNNPWKSWMRLGGFDFFKDNRRAAVCTWQGDVWIVEGLDLPKGKLTWRRIATGMFQPLGLKIVNETIYVCCRDQITRLHDANDDGEIDFYENFNNDHQVTEHFHEFAMDLQTDVEGNFYFAKAARHAKDGLVPHHGIDHQGEQRRLQELAHRQWLPRAERRDREWRRHLFRQRPGRPLDSEEPNQPDQAGWVLRLYGLVCTRPRSGGLRSAGGVDPQQRGPLAGRAALGDQRQVGPTQGHVDQSQLRHRSAVYRAV